VYLNWWPHHLNCKRKPKCVQGQKIRAVFSFLFIDHSLFLRELDATDRLKDRKQGMTWRSEWDKKIQENESRVSLSTQMEVHWQWDLTRDVSQEKGMKKCSFCWLMMPFSYPRSLILHHFYHELISFHFMSQLFPWRNHMSWHSNEQQNWTFKSFYQFNSRTKWKSCRGQENKKRKGFVEINMTKTKPWKDYSNKK